VLYSQFYYAVPGINALRGGSTFDLIQSLCSDPVCERTFAKI
jgi:hypothetical protein